MRDEAWPQGRTPPKRQRYVDPGPKQAREEWYELDQGQEP